MEKHPNQNNDKENKQEDKNEDEQKDQKFSKQELEDQLKYMKELLNQPSRRSGQENIKDKYKFWDTQPVPSFKDSMPTAIGPIDGKDDYDAVRKTPYALPKNFEWYDVDINDKKDLKMVI